MHRIAGIAATFVLLIAGCGDDAAPSSPTSGADVSFSSSQISTEGLPKPILSMLGDESSEIVKWGCASKVDSVDGDHKTSCTVHIGDADTAKTFVHKGGSWVERSVSGKDS